MNALVCTNIMHNAHRTYLLHIKKNNFDKWFHEKLIFPFNKFDLTALELKPFTRFTIAKSSRSSTRAQKRQKSSRRVYLGLPNWQRIASKSVTSRARIKPTSSTSSSTMSARCSRSTRHSSLTELQERHKLHRFSQWAWWKPHSTIQCRWVLSNGPHSEVKVDSEPGQTSTRPPHIQALTNRASHRTLSTKALMAQWELSEANRSTWLCRISNIRAE